MCYCDGSQALHASQLFLHLFVVVVMSLRPVKYSEQRWNFAKKILPSVKGFFALFLQAAVSGDSIGKLAWKICSLFKRAVGHQDFVDT